MWHCKVGLYEKVWFHCGALAGHHARLLLRASLLLVLLCGPQHAVSDSDEIILTEWEIWKSIHGIKYDEKVTQTENTLKIWAPTLIVCIVGFIRVLVLMCFVSCESCDVLCFIAQDDLRRRIIWEENKQIIEANNQRFFMGMRQFTMAMNKYGDLVRTSVYFQY